MRNVVFPTSSVEAMGLEPTNLLTASQALYQLSYAPERLGQVISSPTVAPDGARVHRRSRTRKVGAHSSRGSSEPTPVGAGTGRAPSRQRAPHPTSHRRSDVPPDRTPGPDGPRYDREPWHGPTTSSRSRRSGSGAGPTRAPTRSTPTTPAPLLRAHHVPVPVGPGPHGPRPQLHLRRPAGPPPDHAGLRGALARSASTRSASRPRTPPSRPAPTRGSSPTPGSPS